MPKQTKSDPENYYCSTCERYLSGESQLQKHLGLRHLVVFRVPVSKRIVYTTTGQPFVSLVVDGLSWDVSVELLLFKKFELPRTAGTDIPLQGKWEFIGTCNLDTDLLNMSKKLSHLYQPNCKISETKLKTLLTTSIQRGIYEDRGTNKAKLFLCLDSDLKGKPRHKQSKWVTCTKSRLKTVK